MYSWPAFHRWLNQWINYDDDDDDGYTNEQEEMEWNDLLYKWLNDWMMNDDDSTNDWWLNKLVINKWKMKQWIWWMMTNNMNDDSMNW